MEETTKNIENKESFHKRLQPYFTPSQQLDVKLAYVLAKFGHRAQFRKELDESGNQTRYFEHVRRVSIILLDEMKIAEPEMIISALLHDSLEDTDDLTPELLEHSFGVEVVSIIKLLSKTPKEGYYQRLYNCGNWKTLAIKAADRLDNLRSLMVPGVSREFQKKQIEDTKHNIFPLLNELISLRGATFGLSFVRDEIRRLIERYSVMIEMQEKSNV